MSSLDVQIPHRVGGATALDAVNHEPVLRILDFVRVGLVGDAHLARAAAVDSPVCATAEVPREEL